SASSLGTQRSSAASSPASDTTAMARFLGSWNGSHSRSRTKARMSSSMRSRRSIPRLSEAGARADQAEGEGVELERGGAAARRLPVDVHEGGAVVEGLDEDAARPTHRDQARAEVSAGIEAGEHGKGPQRGRGP